MVLDGVIEGIAAAEVGVKRMERMKVFWMRLDVLSMLIGPLDERLEGDVGEINALRGKSDCGRESE